MFSIFRKLVGLERLTPFGMLLLLFRYRKPLLRLYRALAATRNRRYEAGRKAT